MKKTLKKFQVMIPILQYKTYIVFAKSRQEALEQSYEFFNEEGNLALGNVSDMVNEMKKNA